MSIYLKPDAAKAIERNFDLTDEAWRVLELIVMEFKTDPMSVQCFDFRIVDRAIKTVKEHNELKDKYSVLIH